MGRPRSHQQLAELLSETRWLARRNRRRLDRNVQAELSALQAEAGSALDAGDEARIARATAALEDAARRYLLPLRHSFGREAAEMVAVALLLAVLVRLFVMEAFRIPSGSMVPTLLPGDVVLVNKSAYGVRLPDGRPLIDGPMPARGEVIVFADPQRPEHDLIKRVAGLPGDVITLVEEQIHLDGDPQPRQQVAERFDYWNFSDELSYWHPQSGNLYLEELGGRRYATVHSRLLPRPRQEEGPFAVPEGHLFVLGDNRDESEDGRSDGGWYVPLRAVKGRATLIGFSWGRDGVWPAGESGVRIDRLLRRVDGAVAQPDELPLDEAARRLREQLTAEEAIPTVPAPPPPGARDEPPPDAPGSLPRSAPGSGSERKSAAT